MLNPAEQTSGCGLHLGEDSTKLSDLIMNEDFQGKFVRATMCFTNSIFDSSCRKMFIGKNFHRKTLDEPQSCTSLNVYRTLAAGVETTWAVNGNLFLKASVESTLVMLSKITSCIGHMAHEIDISGKSGLKSYKLIIFLKSHPRCTSRLINAEKSFSVNSIWELLNHD